MEDELDVRGLRRVDTTLRIILTGALFLAIALAAVALVWLANRTP